MIEEARDLERFLPMSYRTPKEEEYVRFLWEAFHDNCASGKYQFAFLAYHMLTMCFVYFNIWQIKLINPKEFETALIGFGKETENELMRASSPFVFSTINESFVMRFLKLIQCDNAKIGTYTKLVKDRNDTAHSNGNIFYNSEDELAAKVREILRIVEEIQSHSEETIIGGYQNFLFSSYDPEDREHIDTNDQIREVLIHENYMSAADLKFCAAYDTSEVGDFLYSDEVDALHAAVCALVADDEALAA
jgi:hypothetical protein